MSSLPVVEVLVPRDCALVHRDVAEVMVVARLPVCCITKHRQLGGDSVLVIVVARLPVCCSTKHRQMGGDSVLVMVVAGLPVCCSTKHRQMGGDSVLVMVVARLPVCCSTKHRDKKYRWGLCTSGGSETSRMLQYKAQRQEIWVGILC